MPIRNDGTASVVSVGSTVSTTNSGGDNQTAFDTITGPPAAGTLAWTSIAETVGTTRGIRFATAGTAGTAMAQWIASHGTITLDTDTYGSMYFFVTGTVGATFTLISLRTGAAGANVGSRIQLNTSNRILVTDGPPNTVRATGTTSIPANQWVRVEYRFRPGSTAANGVVETRLYLNAHAPVGSHDEALTTAGMDTGSATGTAVYWGINTSATNVPLAGGSFSLAHLTAAQPWWPGPSPPPVVADPLVQWAEEFGPGDDYGPNPFLEDVGDLTVTAVAETVTVRLLASTGVGS